MDISINLKGFKSTLDSLHKLPLEIEDLLLETTADTLQLMYDVARERVPVRTGILRDSIRLTDTQVIVDASYGKFVEYGTVKMSAQPFLYPAYRRGRRYFIKRLRNGIKRASTSK